VEGERGAEVFPRLELGGEQLAQGIEAGAARAAQRCRVIVHEAPVQKSRRKPTPLWRGPITLPRFIVSRSPPHSMRHPSPPQISLAYCRIVRSLENGPELATFRIALSAQACGSWYSSLNSQALSHSSTVRPA